jgi:energy-coupling factor transport system ATP-binding protein
VNIADGSSGPALVQARGWGWRHPGRSAWAIRDLNLRIEAGERVLLCGPSGSGKSTLLRGIAGLLERSSGQERGSLSVATDRIGLVLQDPTSQILMSRVGDDVAFGPENLGWDSERIRSAVAQSLIDVGLPVSWTHPTAHLSGGQQQRCAIAGVVAMTPGLLLLDEPTSALDPAGADAVREVIAGLVADRQRTLIVIEHHVDAVIDLVDRVVVLDGSGQVIADGTPDNVFVQNRQALIAAGVWVPGEPPEVAERTDQPGDVVLRAANLNLSRTPEGPIVVDCLSDEWRAGEFTVVHGPNGAGKTTLALALAGLISPRDGHIHAADVLARDAAREPHRWSSRELAGRIGMVFQNPEHQFLAGTVGHEVHDQSLLEELGLGHLVQANPFTLSGGEQRRLSVAIALAAQPSVLVLDEPTYGLDRHMWQVLVSFLRELCDSGRAVIAMSHDRHLSTVAANRVVHLEAADVGQRA